jgi:UDP-N-acetylmuramoylalanine--D-glutamate ligase
MNVAIIGFGRQGRSAYDYWATAGNTITICDREENLDLPNDAHHQTGEYYLNRLDRFDIIVRSPSIHPRDIVARNSPGILKKVTTVTNEFFKVCPTHNIVAVTGTKGKGTTSTLIAKMLEADGKRVHLGGNIGIPPLTLLRQNILPDDWVVLELANFQLIDLEYSPHIAVCLMVVPEHLDWHADSDEYYNAKTQLFRHQTSDDIAIYYDKNETSQRIASTSKGWKIPYMAFPGGTVNDGNLVIDNQVICKTSEVKLLGEHNQQNACAAITAMWKISQNIEAMRTVLTSFTGLEHRLEFVKEVDGIKYYDDSFGTTPESTAVAIKAFTQPIVVILGGSDKGASYDELAQIISSSQIRGVVLIGEQADHIRSALDRAGYSNTVPGGSTMLEIVAAARTTAQPGDIVLLSPACASFDMFQNYEDRGNQFKTVVQSLV